MKKRIFPPDFALILVDIQNDFCPGGALAVPEGDLIVDPVNQLTPLFAFVAATKDWHPANHVSFKAQGGDWPPHCVQGTYGAGLNPRLNLEMIDEVSLKGFLPERDVFEGLEAEITTTGLKLDAVLRQRGIKTLLVTGLATDYCVRGTVLDALKKGYSVNVVLDAIRAVDVQPGDGDSAIREMSDAGASLVTTAEILTAAPLKRVAGEL